MGSLFKPKMPPLPPVQPLPEPPKAEVSQEEKTGLQQNKLRLKENEKAEDQQY